MFGNADIKTFRNVFRACSIKKKIQDNVEAATYNVSVASNRSLSRIVLGAILQVTHLLELFAGIKTEN